MSTGLERLEFLLREAFPESTIEAHLGDSETAMVDVYVQGRVFVVEYLPRQGYGVSELEESSAGLFDGHEESYREAGEAVSFIRGRLK